MIVVHHTELMQLIFFLIIFKAKQGLTHANQYIIKHKEKCTKGEFCTQFSNHSLPNGFGLQMHSHMIQGNCIIQKRNVISF